MTTTNQTDNNKLKKPQANITESKLSALSIVLCRICYDNDKDEPLIAPCHCKGSVAFVHRSCLERWLAESNSTTCELCHQYFRTERTPKYTSQESIWRWIRYHHIPGGGGGDNNNNNGRGARGDIIACTIITPLAIILTYICLFSSEYYNQRKFVTVSAAKWTSVSLLAMIAVMLMGYYLWVYSVIRLHSRMWYNWWQRECVVRYIPPAAELNFTNNNNNENVPPTNTPNSNFSIIDNDSNSIVINLDDEEEVEEMTNYSLNSSIQDGSNAQISTTAISIEEEDEGEDEEVDDGKNGKETIV